MTTQQMKLRKMIITALFAAIIGILAQITIPLPLVPITGQTLAIGLAATILGSRLGSLAVIVYIILGAAGIPVYAEMKAGISVLFGPTGGYLVGFIPSAFIIGWFLEKTSYKVLNAMVANTIGMLITLSIGTVWLKISAGLAWEAAFMGGFYPFIIVGLIKAGLASWIGILVRQRLISAKLLISEKRDIITTA
jgi:biotin transport system substrate-specific component